MTELRDQDDNKAAAVAAARSLEQISDDQAQRPNAANAQPGVTIRIVNVQQTLEPTTIDVTPTPAKPAELEPPASLPDPIFRLR